MFADFRGVWDVDRLVGMLARTFSKVCSGQINTRRTQRSCQRPGRFFALYGHVNLLFDDGIADSSNIQICSTLFNFFHIPNMWVAKSRGRAVSGLRSEQVHRMLDVAPDTCFQGLAKRSQWPLLGAESIRHSAYWHSNRTLLVDST